MTRKRITRNRNNYGWRSRSITVAGIHAINHAVDARYISNKSGRDYRDRWAWFCKFLKDEHGVKWAEDITRSHLAAYARSLRAKGLAASTIQVYVSAVNSTLRHMTRGRWQSIGPVSDLDVERRSYVRTTPPLTVDPQTVAQVTSELRTQERYADAAFIALVYAFGLRRREASYFSARYALRAVKKQLAAGLSPSITVRRGAKGGRLRNIPIRTEQQVIVLEEAAKYQPGRRSMIPDHMSWAQWRENHLRKLGDLLPAGMHDLRRSYACIRYQEITGCPVPVLTPPGSTLPPNDEEARLIIARELGHGRTQVVAAYIGGRR